MVYFIFHVLQNQDFRSIHFLFCLFTANEFVSFYLYTHGVWVENGIEVLRSSMTNLSAEITFWYDVRITYHWKYMFPLVKQTKCLIGRDISEKKRILCLSIDWRMNKWITKKEIRFFLISSTFSHLCLFLHSCQSKTRLLPMS